MSKPGLLPVCYQGDGAGREGRSPDPWNAPLLMAALPLWLQAMILGMVQGLTEFLPVSSSAHLVLLPALTGSEYFGKSFDVALHGGTLAALLLAMPDESRALGRALQGALLGRWRPEDPLERLGLLALLGALPAAAVGFLLEHRVVQWFHGLPCLALALAGFGLVMGVVDLRAGRSRELAALGPREALLLGLAQALALVPGVSRSGATLTAGRALGLARQDAAWLSFLFAFPVLGGATLVKALRGFELPSPELAAPMLAGVVAAAASGLVGLRILRRHLAGGTLLPFAVYRVLAGLALLAWALGG